MNCQVPILADNRLANQPDLGMLMNDMHTPGVGLGGYVNAAGPFLGGGGPACVCYGYAIDCAVGCAMCDIYYTIHVEFKCHVNVLVIHFVA